MTKQKNYIAGIHADGRVGNTARIKVSALKILLSRGMQAEFLKA